MRIRVTGIMYSTLYRHSYPHRMEWPFGFISGVDRMYLSVQHTCHPQATGKLPVEPTVLQMWDPCPQIFIPLLTEGLNLDVRYSGHISACVSDKLQSHSSRSLCGQDSKPTVSYQ